MKIYQEYDLKTPDISDEGRGLERQPPGIPCAFCGNTPEVSGRWCEAVSYRCITASCIIARLGWVSRKTWNTRADVNALQAEIAELENERETDLIGRMAVRIADLIDSVNALQADAATRMKTACVANVRESVSRLAEKYREEFKPDGSSFSVMKREVCFKVLREVIPELEAIEINDNQS